MFSTKTHAVYSLILPIAAALWAALGFPAVAKVSRGGPECKTLERNCLAYVARQRAVSGVRAEDDPDPSVDDYCRNAFSEARQTGVWPPHGGRPEIGCRNN